MIIDKFLDDVFLLKNNTFFDDRGFFFESFNSNFLEVTNIKNPFVQDNISFSKEKFTLRGLHYQKGKYKQAKLIFLISGSIFDVFVDARPNSKNFGQYGFVKLNNPGDSIYVPRGYLHGFCTLEENTTIRYKVDNFYNKDSELNVLWNDHDLKIDWGLFDTKPIISEKDNNAMTWQSFNKEII